MPNCMSLNVEVQVMSMGFVICLVLAENPTFHNFEQEHAKCYGYTSLIKQISSFLTFHI